MYKTFNNILSQFIVMQIPDSPKEVVEEYISAYNERDIERIEAVVADEIESGENSYSREGLTEAIQAYWHAFPDCRIDVEQYVIDDGMVTVRVVFSGTHQEEYYGLDPTGEEFEVAEIMMWRVNEDELNGYWPVWDEMGFFEQLGVIEHPIS